MSGDGKIDIRDAIQLLREIGGMKSVAGAEQALGDLNGDGRLTIADAILLLRKVVRR